MDRRWMSIVGSCLSLLCLALLGATPAHAAACAPAWSCSTSYGSGAQASYNGHNYTMPYSRAASCPGYNPSVDNWWTDNGACSGGGGGGTPTPTAPPTATPTSGGGATPTRTNTPTATATSGGSGGGSCSGVPAFATCTAYASGAKAVFNNTLYHTLAPIPTTRDCPPNSPYNPSSDNWWQNDGACGSGGGGGATPTATPTSGGGGGGGGAAGLRFCPYIDVSPGSGSAIMQLASNGSGNKCYSLAFILGYGCQASWFGAYPLNTAEAAGIGSRIQELKNAGGNVIISFGGAAAPELANVCSSASALAAQYQAVINMYHPMAIDLDIEDFNPTAIDIRNQALTQISGAPIHYTLGVLPSGMTSAQISVLQNAKSHNVNVSMVNIMAMDYGGAQDMYAAAISAANATKSQMSSVGYGSAQLGITPMIGVNDVSVEVFSLANAQSLRNNAAGASMLAFWSVGRDNGGCIGVVSPSCSGVSQSTFQFSKILQSY